jgi:peptide/nickel transport system permease protein
MRIVGRRLLQLIPVLFGVSFITFIMLNLLPGDPAVAILGDQATPEALENLRRTLGLDRPLLVRYVDWVWDAMRGDLGTSYRNNLDVRETILQRLPVSLEILILAQILALGLAIPVAALAVWKRNTAVDRIIGLSAFTGLSMPNFLLAIILILVLSVNMGLLPATGYVPLEDGLRANLRTVLLPAVTLAFSEYAVYMRLLRSEMIDTLREEYVTTAFAKGLSTRRVLVRHVMRNSLFSLITVVGVNMGTLLGGAVITETIFAVPGLGRLLIDSIYQRDLIVVQGVVLFVAVAYVLVNLTVDLIYALLDPRIRHGH